MDLPPSQKSDAARLPQPEGAVPAASIVVHRTDGPAAGYGKPNIAPYDFRCPAFLSPAELRKLRVEHEAFIQGLAARISIHLRADFGLRLSELESLTYQKFIEALPDPCHLTLFKADPLRGICILELAPKLGLAVIDRLMGGPGRASASDRALSDIDLALLEQVVRLIVGEWCQQWLKLQELRPVLLGHESSGRFLQTSQPDAVILAVSMEAHMGECVEPIRMAFPYATLQPLIRALARQIDRAAQEANPPPAAKSKWSRDFDNLSVCMSAEYAGIKLTARELAGLKTGDVIPLPPDFPAGVRLSLAKKPRFVGRLGSCGRQAAVELTQILSAGGPAL